jgi:uncharacterized membrane protein YqjE
MAVTTDNERPIRFILQDIVANLQDIIRLEVQLAKAELKQEATRFSRAFMWVVAGGALALYAVGFLLLAAVYALSDIMRPWQAAVLVAAIVAVLAASLLVSGVRRVSQLKEDVKWIKDQNNQSR